MKHLCWILVLLISCGKNGKDIIPLEGTYIGYFHRNGRDTALVRINFTSGNFKGESSKTLFPLICKGSFQQKDNKISFEDLCLTNEKKNETVRLEGEFNYQYNHDGTLRLWRQNISILDEYILRPLFR
jgi:hypothetical protein